MKRSDILAARLYNQQISQQAFGRPAEVAAWLGAVQAQDYAHSKWALGLRLPGGTDAGVEAAVREGSIVRTWLLRGTLHIVAAADVRWMLDLLGTGQLSRSAGIFGQKGLDEKVLAKSNGIIARALRGGKQLSRKALFNLLERRGISTAEQRGINMLTHAALSGIICVGPWEGKQPTFVLLDDWVPAAPGKTREEALAMLAERYFNGHGPATLQDFIWWSGLPASDARMALEMVKGGLARADVNGETYWLPQHMPAVKIAAGKTYLLPAFDEYLLGYRDRSHVVDGEYIDQVATINGIFNPLIISGGRAVGTWKRTFKKDTVTVVPAPFAALSAAGRAAFEKAARRYAEYCGLLIG